MYVNLFLKSSDFRPCLCCDLHLAASDLPLLFEDSRGCNEREGRGPFTSARSLTFLTSWTHQAGHHGGGPPCAHSEGTLVLQSDV